MMDNDRGTNPDPPYPSCLICLTVTTMSVESPFDGVRNSRSVHRKKGRSVRGTRPIPFPVV
jgi:hypothetical protein